MNEHLRLAAVAFPRSTLGWGIALFYVAMGAIVGSMKLPPAAQPDIGHVILFNLLVPAFVMSIFLVWPINLLFARGTLPFETLPLLAVFALTGLIYARCIECALSRECRRSTATLALLVVASGPISSFFALLSWVSRY